MGTYYPSSYMLLLVCAFLENQFGGSKILSSHFLESLKYVTAFWGSIAVKIG